MRKMAIVRIRIAQATFFKFHLLIASANVFMAFILPFSSCCYELISKKYT